MSLVVGFKKGLWRIGWTPMISTREQPPLDKRADTAAAVSNPNEVRHGARHPGVAGLDVSTPYVNAARSLADSCRQQIPGATRRRRLNWPDPERARLMEDLPRQHARGDLLAI